MVWSYGKKDNDGMDFIYNYGKKDNDGMDFIYKKIYIYTITLIKYWLSIILGIYKQIIPTQDNFLFIYFCAK